MHSFSSHFILNRISKNVEIGQTLQCSPPLLTYLPPYSNSNRKKKKKCDSVRLLRRRQQRPLRQGVRYMPAPARRHTDAGLRKEPLPVPCFTLAPARALLRCFIVLFAFLLELTRDGPCVITPSIVVLLRPAGAHQRGRRAGGLTSRDPPPHAADRRLPLQLLAGRPRRGGRREEPHDPLHAPAPA